MKKTKILSLLLLLAVSFLLLTGCQTKNGLNGSNATKADTVTITDDAGRSVEIPSPEKLNKVFYTSPMGMIPVYAIAPDKMAGTSFTFTEKELKYLEPSVKNLENLGGMQVGAELNKEKILSSGAQIILNVSPNKIDENSKSEADKLQEQLNLPVVLIDGSLEKSPQMCRTIGKILGAEERSEELAKYSENVLNSVKESIAKVPEDQRVALYYAEKNDGLCTEPDTSSHAASLKYAGVKNVADIEGKKGSGLSPVSLENIIAWNPSVIITWADGNGGAYSHIKSDPDWSNIDAVKNNRVYAMPFGPFRWLDRPPSLNRIMGIQWAANLLYPEYYKIDIKKETKEFYKLFYHVDLTDEQATEILDGAL